MLVNNVLTGQLKIWTNIKVRILPGAGDARLSISKLCMAIPWAIVELADPYSAHLGSCGVCDLWKGEESPWQSRDRY